jgi:hypothetical protein
MGESYTGDVETQQTQLSLLARSNISNVPEAVVLILLAGHQKQHADGISSLMIRRAYDRMAMASIATELTNIC